MFYTPLVIGFETREVGYISKALPLLAKILLIGTWTITMSVEHKNLSYMANT